MKDHSKSRLPAGQTWEPLNPVNDGMVQVGEAGQIVDINAEALRLMRCRSQSPAGRDFWDLVPQEIADQYQNATEKALASSAQHAFVAHHKFENCWLEYSFRRRIPGYIVRLRDVSSTHKLQRLLEDSERFNALIFEVNPNAMWIFDTASLRILAVNRASIEFYGIARKEFVTLRMGALFPDGEGSSLLSTLGPGNKPDDTPLELQLCKQKKGDGQLVLVELACGRISWNDHEAVLVSLADVTDRHLADRALRRESAALEQETEGLLSEITKGARV